MANWSSKITGYYSKDESAGKRDGCITPALYEDSETEYWLVRRGIGLGDYSYYGKIKVAGEGALDLINRMSLADISRVPINRMMSSFVLNEDGSVLGEIYVANYGDYYLVLGEGTEPQQLLARLQAAAEQQGEGTTVMDLTESQALFGLDGPFAWELLKMFMGAGVIGIRYLEVVMGNELEGIPFTLYRTGKTGEYGYLLQTEATNAVALWQALLQKGQDFHLNPVGYQTIDRCKLENRFINMHQEGTLAKHILELNTRVMISRDKDDYVGRKAVEAAIQNGIERRLIGLVLADAVATQPAPVATGDNLYCEAEEIGEIANIGYSYTLQQWIALAFIKVDYAYVGLDYQVQSETGRHRVRTISAPFIFNRSLRIRPQEDSYFNEV